jgi:para-aminobenzoate synthetase/4-amino-4-deoxychorismate lyase
MGIGSGIVIDSDPAAEFSECLLKAEFLTRSSDPSLANFSLIESLLWRGEYPLIELHLDRLEDSARYFGFPCDRATTKAALIAHAKTLAAPRSSKVRLLLNHDGNLQIESEPLPASTLTGHTKPARLRVATQRTDPSDPMLFHKTTHRPVYAAAFKAAVDGGFDDVLFLNLRGEVTECAINNIFVEKDGHFFTSPIECGLLPGVHRRHVLETKLSAIERVLLLDDLRLADAIYLSNAVRGLRPATIEWDG